MTVDKALKMKNSFTEIIKNEIEIQLYFLEYIDFEKIIQSNEKVFNSSNLKFFFKVKDLLDDSLIDKYNEDVENMRIKSNVLKLLNDKPFVETFCKGINHILKNLNNLE